MFLPGRLLQMQEVVGSNPTEAKICVSHFTLLEWNVKNCFAILILIYLLIKFIN